MPYGALLLRALCAGYPAGGGRPERRVLEGLAAVALPGELTVLVGPAGAGKSTLLRTMAALQPALSGEVLTVGSPPALVPAADLSAWERVPAADALARGPAAILLDEPAASLDAASRDAFMDRLRRLAGRRHLVIVASTDDLALALRVADRVWLLEPGGALRSETPQELRPTGPPGTPPDGGELRCGTPASEGGGFASDAGELCCDPASDGGLGSDDGELSCDPVVTGPLVAEERVLATAVADVGSLGGYFDLAPPGAGESGEGGWRPLSDLFAGSPALAAKIDEVAERLGTSEARIAASILFQGLAARLWSPPFGVAVAHGLLLDLAPADLWWRPVPSGPLPLRTTRLSGRHVRDSERHVRDPGRSAAWLYQRVVTGQLEPLAESVAGLVKLAPGLLWGNAASALAGTVRAVARWRPDLAGTAAGLGRELLEIGRLRGTGVLAEPAPAQPFFVRRSCCLYYRLPGGGKCGDCSLIPDEARRADWARTIREAGQTS
ncbi:ATP-binding cassette domain-containing protein [Nonomuraea sp. NPDC050643]|uniref:ATP-binding cassette domain-containing protein n=1 Tax=Nonomuraea sp. NPDC050643 TaxID=3155660 RepID=UPI0033ED4330